MSLVVKSLLSKIASNSYLGDSLETFPEMGLNGCWVFSLRENLKKLIIGQEVESRECVSLGLQIFTESLLYLLQ